MRRLSIALVLLLLTLAAAAQDSPRDWALNIDDFRSQWPARYRVHRAGEKAELHDVVTEKLYSYTYFDKKSVVVLMSQAHREASTLRAQMAFTTFKFAAGHDKEDDVDYSAQVKAGEASHCTRTKSGSWLFACRQKRVWTYTIISGLELTPQEMSKIARNYARRLDSLQTAPKTPKRNGIWRY